jgi:hypothetical protein
MPIRPAPFAFFVFLLLLYGPLAPAEAETYALVDGRRAGDALQIKATMRVLGTLHSPTGQLKEVPMAANCQVAFQQVLQSISRRSSITAARQYDTAMAEIRVGDQQETTRLPASLSTIVASRQDGQVELVSPSGGLARKELDLITLPGDIITVYGLLPDEPVSVGQHWTHAAEALAAVLNLEHVGVNETKSELLKVENGLAQMRITGLVKGRASGVATEMRITGDYRYDLRWQHVNWLHLRIKEQRDESPVAPRLNVDAELRMLIAPLPAPEVAAGLDNVREISVRDRLLRYESAAAGYQLKHGRRWHLVDEQPRHAAWRIVEDDDVIAQCNAIRLKDLPAGKKLALEEFQGDIQKALGDQFGQFETANQQQRGDGSQILRVGVRGVAKGIPVRWVYYHVANSQGQRANLVFVMDVENIDRLGTDDVVAATSLAITASSDALPEIADPAPLEQPVAETASRRSSPN